MSKALSARLARLENQRGGGPAADAPSTPGVDIGLLKEIVAAEAQALRCLDELVAKRPNSLAGSPDWRQKSVKVLLARAEELSQATREPVAPEILDLCGVTR